MRKSENKQNISHKALDCTRTQPCQNNATCINNILGVGYSCIFLNGYTGVNCETRDYYKL